MRRDDVFQRPKTRGPASANVNQFTHSIKIRAAAALAANLQKSKGDAITLMGLIRHRAQDDRKRMRAKLPAIKMELRRIMHNPSRKPVLG
jgi:hypothetical protein